MLTGHKAHTRRRFDHEYIDNTIADWRSAATQARDPDTQERLSRLADQLESMPWRSSLEYQGTSISLNKRHK